jgi:hypothetical protein
MWSATNADVSNWPSYKKGSGTNSVDILWSMSVHKNGGIKQPPPAHSHEGGRRTYEGVLLGAPKEFACHKRWKFRGYPSNYQLVSKDSVSCSRLFGSLFRAQSV